MLTLAIMEIVEHVITMFRTITSIVTVHTDKIQCIWAVLIVVTNKNSI